MKNTGLPLRITLSTTVRRVLAASGMAVLLLTTSSALGNAGQATVPVAPVASVSPAPSDVVGVAHPVTITFAEPVADRAAAQRSVRFTSAGMPAGEFSWLGDDVLQWKPTAGYLP